jgi:hypothetical protein
MKATREQIIEILQNYEDWMNNQSYQRGVNRLDFPKIADDILAIEQKEEDDLQIERHYQRILQIQSDLKQKEIEQKESKSAVWRNDHILSEFENEFGHHPTSTNKYRWQGVNWLLEKLAQQQQKPMDEPYEPYVPYFGWCDVSRCKNEGCCGGTEWRETGYWTLCSKHSQMAREGKDQPKMKQEAVKREKRRDKKTGYLKQ